MDLVERLRRHDDDRLYHEADVLMSEAADEIPRLRKIEAAAKNLIAQKGRHHTEQAYKLLEESLK